MARPRSKFTPAQEKRIFSLWEKGRSATAIATDIGTARATLVRVLREAGITVERRRWAHHGERHHLWRGGRVIVQGGYIGVHVSSDSPFACMGHRRHKDSNASAVYVLEHRLVMAKKLGRALSNHETVHHINGIKDDNRPANLEVRIGRHGKGVVMICAECGSRNLKAITFA